MMKRMRIGLVSDTHMPRRWPEIPAAVYRLFEGVDLILHSGDVGELWVLDRLSQIAPVIAVHGNDETEDARRELPYQQVLGVQGLRLLLCHSHHPDREQEMAARRSDEMLPKLEARAAAARQAGAGVYVYGHTHIPMAREVDNVMLVNPGAIASGNLMTRQVIQTVAVLEILDGVSGVCHFDLASGEGFEPDRYLKEGYRQTASAYLQPIVPGDLYEKIATMRMPEFACREAISKAMHRVAHRCWSGELEAMTAEDLCAEVEGDGAIVEEDKALFLELLG